jgi:hypothetical protein
MREDSRVVVSGGTPQPLTPKVSSRPRSHCNAASQRRDGGRSHSPSLGRGKAREIDKAFVVVSHAGRMAESNHPPPVLVLPSRSGTYNPEPLIHLYHNLGDKAL